MPKVRKFVAMFVVVTMLAFSFLPVAGFSPRASAGAPAGGKGRVDKCSNNGILVVTVIQCSGVLNGNKLEIEIGDINILSNNDLTVLKDSLNNWFVGVNGPVTVKDVQVKVVEIANNKLLIPIFICQVKVVEIGLVNLNIAKC
jgi:hypothetical protein